MLENDTIEGISASEYIRGVKNGNIEPTYDNAIRAILWAADELEKLLLEHIDDTKDKFKLHYPKEPGSLGRDMIWYLVVEMLSSTLPGTGVMRGPDPLIGPITEQQCEEVKAKIDLLPGVVVARCRKAVGMTATNVNRPSGYVRPLFEGDDSVVTGSDGGQPDAANSAGRITSPMTLSITDLPSLPPKNH